MKFGAHHKTGDAEIPEAGHPLVQLRHAHAAMLALCDRLEAIADSLPSDVSQFECEAVARAIVPLLESAQRFEEEVVFPYCVERSQGGCSVVASFDRLRAEHREDMSYGEEIAEALRSIGSKRPVSGAETLGFMLRGFFGPLRRHIAFEADYVCMTAGTDQPDAAKSADKS